MPSEVVNGNFRLDRLPHIWCPGCGHGILMHAVAKAIDELEIDKDKILLYAKFFQNKRLNNLIKRIFK